MTADEIKTLRAALARVNKRGTAKDRWDYETRLFAAAPALLDAAEEAEKLRAERDRLRGLVENVLADHNRRSHILRGDETRCPCSWCIAARKAIAAKKDGGA